MDITYLTEEVIRRLELRIGRRLDWVATNHFNTGLQHSHILINGFDLDGNKFKFPRDEIKTFIRESCRDICTELVGYLTIEERNASYQNMITKNSFTPIDRLLDSYSESGKKITLMNVGILKQGNILHKRLLYLKDLGLVSLDQNTYVPDFFILLKNLNQE